MPSSARHDAIQIAWAARRAPQYKNSQM